MYKSSIYTYLLFILLFIETNAQNVRPISKIMEIADMTKLIGMDIDDATNYLSEYDYTLTKKDINNRGMSYLLFDFELGRYHTLIQLYYKDQEVYSLYYVVTNKELRKYLNDNIKKLGLKKIHIADFDNAIITYYQGKVYRYEKHEKINSVGSQQIEFFITNKFTYF